MALQLKNDELAIVLALARPISAARQPQFLQEVAAELEAKGGAIARARWHRLARTIRRKYFEPPQTLTVPLAGERLRCSACGGKTISTRPAWHTTQRQGTQD